MIPTYELKYVKVRFVYLNFAIIDKKTNTKGIFS